MPLAVRGGTGDHLDLAGGQDPYGCRLPTAGAVVQRGQNPAGSQAAHFHVRRYAQPQVDGRPFGAPRRLFGPAAVPVDEFLSSVQGRLVVAGVKGQTGCRVVGELVGRDEVAGADLIWSHPDGLSQGIHGPLDGVGGLWSSSAPVGVGRGEVGEHPRAGERVQRYVVGAVEEECPEKGDTRGNQLQVGTHIGQEVGSHGGEATVGVGG